jgi:allantoinase
VETCPHYLLFSEGDVGEGQTWFKCAPPIRGPDNRAALLSAVAHGGIHSLASDHSPCTPELKHTDTGDFLKAWGGISGATSW